MSRIAQQLPLKTRLVNGLLNLVFPLECLVCRAEGNWLCRDCQAALVLTRPITCSICSKAAENGICLPCAKKTRLDGVVSLFSYRQTAISRLIKAVKFGHYLSAFSFLVEEYGKQMAERLPKGEYALVPIPLSDIRKRERGFNRAWALSEALSKYYVSEIWDGLKRTSHTAPQAELSRAERLKNVRGVFAVNCPDIPEWVILVDDVATTGATAAEAAKALRKAGVKSVWLLTVAHG